MCEERFVKCPSLQHTNSDQALFSHIMLNCYIEFKSIFFKNRLVLVLRLKAIFRFYLLISAYFIFKRKTIIRGIYKLQHHICCILWIISKKSYILQSTSFFSSLSAVIWVCSCSMSCSDFTWFSLSLQKIYGHILINLLVKKQQHYFHFQFLHFKISFCLCGTILSISIASWSIYPSSSYSCYCHSLTSYFRAKLSKAWFARRRFWTSLSLQYPITRG